MSVRFLTGLCLIIMSSNIVLASSIEQAKQLQKQGHHGDAVSIYEDLLEQNPKDFKLRLAYADALSWNRQWDEAITEYNVIIKQDPDNAEALRGIGTVQRWRGHITESIQASEKVLVSNANDLSALLSLASSLELDHDYEQANARYDEAQRKWPDSNSVKQQLFDFQRKRNPSLHLYYEDDLSFLTKRIAVMSPFGSREEVGVEYQNESRPGIYDRKDYKLNYKHYFGFNHLVDFRLRYSKFGYNIPVTAFSAIDSFKEYRIGYTHPIVPEHAVRIRYTLRPTSLFLSGQDFMSHKVEASLESRWTPRVNTTLGTGWLRDLPENATATEQLANNSLVHLGLNIDVTNDLQLSGKYITNPDLDNTIDRTLIAQTSYTLTSVYSILGRYILEDYKVNDDETTYYLALRYNPNSRIWTEAGLKYVERGIKNGFYPLVSVVFRL